MVIVRVRFRIRVRVRFKGKDKDKDKEISVDSTVSRYILLVLIVRMPVYRTIAYYRHTHACMLSSTIV